MGYGHLPPLGMLTLARPRHVPADWRSLFSLIASYPSYQQQWTEQDATG